MALPSMRLLSEESMDEKCRVIHSCFSLFVPFFIRLFVDVCGRSAIIASDVSGVLLVSAAQYSSTHC